MCLNSKQFKSTKAVFKVMPNFTPIKLAVIVCVSFVSIERMVMMMMALLVAVVVVDLMVVAVLVTVLATR